MLSLNLFPVTKVISYVYFNFLFFVFAAVIKFTEHTLKFMFYFSEIAVYADRLKF